MAFSCLSLWFPICNRFLVFSLFFMTLAVVKSTVFVFSVFVTIHPFGTVVKQLRIGSCVADFWFL